MKSNFYKPLLDHKFIVYGADHGNPLGMVRSLGEVGIKADVVLVGENPSLIPASKYPNKIFYVITNEEGLDFIVKNYSSEPEKVYILTGSDDTTALLNEHYNELKDKFFFYNCGEQGRMGQMMQKAEQIKIAQECGVRIAESEIVKVGQFPTKVKYPLITKAVNSLVDGWKKNVFICHDEAELIDAYKHIDEDEIMLQEYIHKKNELCIDGITVNSYEPIQLPIGAYYYRLFDDSYGLYYYYTKLDNPELVKKIDRMLKRSRYIGIFCVEFLVDKNDNLYFLEINYRNSGWSHAMTRAGYNMVYAWCKSMLTNCIDTSDIDIPKLPYSCMVETSEFRTNVRKGRVSLWQFLKDVKHCDYLTYWDKRDNGPFWTIIKQMSKRGFKKIF